MKNIIFSIILTAALAACSSSRNPKPLADNPFSKKEEELNGDWLLTAISGMETAFDSMFREGRAYIRFDIASLKASGNTGCNSFNTEISLSKDSIHFSEKMMMTKMFCEGHAELTFVEALRRVNTYHINRNVLELREGSVPVMHLVRKK